jgi:hypothetical protein
MTTQPRAVPDQFAYLSAAVTSCPETVTNLPVGGHENCLLADSKSAHPSD